MLLQNLNAIAPNDSLSVSTRAGHAVHASLKAGDNSRPEDISAAFSRGGVLVRTVQLPHAHKELHHCGISVDNARNLHASGASQHGGLRKWTLAHANLVPNYFAMGPNVTGMPRHMAFLALPEKVGRHIVGIHEKDNASGNVAPDMSVIHDADARFHLNKMLASLIKEQNVRQSERLENNEVQTVGIEPGAIAGLLFYPVPSKPHWLAARADFQKVIDKGGPEFAGRAFPVFTYQQDEGTQVPALKLLDTLVKREREAHEE